MTEPIMCLTAAASHPETQIPADDAMALYREAGFDHIVYWGVELSQPWADAIFRLRNLGFKVIARWPHHDACGNLLPEYAFRAWDGRSNAVPDGRLCGPSHWHPDVLDRAAPSLKPLVDMGLDGVLISLLECDRPYPTDWYGNAELVRYSRAFWCWDEHARRDWKEHSRDGWMPYGSSTAPVDTQRFADFYAWYQGSWLRRLLEYSVVAHGAGVRNLWTWFTPLLDPVPTQGPLTDGMLDSLANGTSDAVELMHEGWYLPMKDLGLNPVTVSPVCANLWPRWLAAGVRGMQYATQVLGWRAISGPGCNEGREVAVRNLQFNSDTLADIGFSGPFAGESFLREQDGLREAGLAARGFFKRGVVHPLTGVMSATEQTA